mmetsp:Transcript_23801/g.40390  ORF Transcript_23801/g.40390 Transcript_23801/m.40390 type:complete len:113 (-) Transcript_23801:104-442(-)
MGSPLGQRVHPPGWGGQPHIAPSVTMELQSSESDGTNTDSASKSPHVSTGKRSPKLSAFSGLVMGEPSQHRLQLVMEGAGEKVGVSVMVLLLDELAFAPGQPQASPTSHWIR